MDDEKPGSKIPPSVPLKEKQKRWKAIVNKDKKPIDAYAAGFGAITNMQKKIAAITQHGEDLLEFLARAYRGEEPDIKGRDRIVAAQELATRLWGKPVDVQITAQVSQQQAAKAIEASPEDLLMTIRKLQDEGQEIEGEFSKSEEEES